MNENPIKLICPRCGNFIPNNDTPGAYPGALSRYSELGAIEVCSDCGQQEAMIQFAAMSNGSRGHELQEVVHPVYGEYAWTEPNPDIGV